MTEASQRIAAVSADTVRLFGVDVVPLARGAATGRESGRAAAGGSAPAEIIEAKPFEDRPAAPKIATPARDRKQTQEKLDALRARYEADAPHRHFVTDHHSIVFGEGDPCARLMFIGEAPGAEEDKTGRPFVGKAGQLLEKMIEAMGLKREDVYICNVLKTRPPGNATPTGREAELCKPYLIDQIRIVKPEAIVTLGLPATKTVLAREDTMGNMRAKFSRVTVLAQQGVMKDESLGGSFEVPVMPTYHPAYLLRDYTPENRKKVWSDLLQVVHLLGLTPKASAAG